MDVSGMNTSNVYGYGTNTYACTGNSKKTTPDASFQETIQKAETNGKTTDNSNSQWAGDMVIPQPPRTNNVQYDNSISSKSKDEMTLDEYKQWVANEMSQMPVSGWYQSTCVGGSLTITEECFERMKTDPEWENTVLGMVREMYSVNGIMGSKMIGFQVIGASPEECYGEGIPVDSNSGLGSTDNKKSWWQKRHEETEEILKEQSAKALQKRKTQHQEMIQQMYEASIQKREQYSDFLSSGETNAQNTTATMETVATGQLNKAVDAYTSKMVFDNAE